MKRYFCISVLFLLTALPAAAQSADEELSRRIEVTRKYSPDVERARKLDFSPNMTDTVSLHPYMEYSITPTPWKTVFGTEPLSPVKISTEEFRPSQPFYVRMAVGAPFQSLADLYVLAPTRSDMVLGAYVNHYGRWAKIRNDMGDKRTASKSLNSAGAFLEKDLGRRKLNISADYDYRYYRPNGAFLLADMPSLDELGDYHGGKISYGDFRVGALFGDPFTDMSRFNYRVGAALGLFRDRHGVGDNDYSLLFDMGWGLSAGELVVETRYDGWNNRTGNGSTGNRDDRVMISPYYSYLIKNFGFTLGFDFIWNQHYKVNDFYIFPRIKLQYAPLNAMMPYLVLGGTLGEANYSTMSRQNPYMAWSDGVLNPSSYYAVFGIHGALIPEISYDIYVGCDLYKNYTYYITDYVDDRFSYMHDTADVYPFLFRPYSEQGKSTNLFNFGVDLNFLIAKGLTLDLKWRQNMIIDNDNTDADSASDYRAGTGIPKFEFRSGLKYNYRDKLFLTLGMEIAGRRTYTVKTYSARTADAPEGISYRKETVGSSVNLMFEAEYKVMQRLNIFVRGDNLLNRRIYEFNHYAALGLNVLAGFKVLF